MIGPRHKISLYNNVIEFDHKISFENHMIDDDDITVKINPLKPPEEFLLMTSQSK